MINYLKGILVSKSENANYNVTVEVNNIGYSILTNKRNVSALPEIGENITFYTSLIHREDTMYLCGFLNREERDLFNILQSVSGIGTKVALLLLEIGAHELVSAVIRGDDKALSKAKGVGPKLAQRMILELKDKMTNWHDTIDPSQIQSRNFDSEEEEESILETESVLLSLGYSSNEIREGLEAIMPGAVNKSNPEELLRLTLQWLANQ
jgi:holliday junction DNA helicase RuvA